MIMFLLFMVFVAGPMCIVWLLGGRLLLRRYVSPFIHRRIAKSLSCSVEDARYFWENGEFPSGRASLASSTRKRERLCVDER